MSSEPGVVITEMFKADLPDVLSIENHSFKNPWPLDSFENELQNPRSKFFVVRASGRISAYGGYRIFEGDSEILNLAVRGDQRRRGLADKLLSFMIGELLNSGAKNIFLEVRSGASEAKNLYSKHGFEPVYMRKNYYAGERQDAVVMKKIL